MLIGYDTALDAAKMARVCDLVRAGLPYIATHPDYNCPAESGFAPDIGVIIALIQVSTGRKPDVVIGKLHQGMVEETMRVTGLRAGDRLYTDIAMAAVHGMLGVLVLTGETVKADIQHAPDQPDIVLDRLSDLIPYL